MKKKMLLFTSLFMISPYITFADVIRDDEYGRAVMERKNKPWFAICLFRR